MRPSQGVAWWKAPWRLEHRNLKIFSPAAPEDRRTLWAGFLRRLQLSTNNPQLTDNVSDSDYTFTSLPSGKTMRIQIIAANDAGEAQPSITVEIVVP